MIHLIYFCSKSHFQDDGTQNYLVFQPMYRYYKKISNTDRILVWKSKGLSDESVKPPATSNNSLVPALSYVGIKTRIKLVGSCLKKDKVTFTRGNIVNTYTVY